MENIEKKIDLGMDAIWNQDDNYVKKFFDGLTNKNRVCSLFAANPV